MAGKFTISVAKIPQNKVMSFNDIKMFHHECLDYKLVRREIRKNIWEIGCPKCKQRITIRHGSLGTLPLIQTAIDGEERMYSHDLAKEKVIQIDLANVKRC